MGAAVASSVSSGEAAGPRAAASDDRSPEGHPGPSSGDRHRKDRREGDEHEDEDDDRDRRRGPDYAVSRLLHEQLDLDSDQERRVEAILERRRRRAHEIFDATKSRLRSQFDSAMAEIKRVLTDTQASRFDSLVADLKERKGWRGDREDGDGAERGGRPDGRRGHGGGR